MRTKTLTILLFSLFLIFILFNTNSQAEELRDYGNKIYYSPDKNIILICVNDNSTLGMYCTYEFYLINTQGLNLSVKYNNTEIGIKRADENAVMGTFYVNDTEFVIRVTPQDNSTTFITVKYYAEGGFIPIPWHDKSKLDRWYRRQVEQITPITLTLENVLRITGMIILLTVPFLTIIALLIKYHKEHHTVEGDFVASKRYYEIGDVREDNNYDNK